MWDLPLRRLAVAALLLFAATPVFAQAPTPCEGFQYVPYQGPSCPVPGGWRVLLADGTSVLTHGPDMAPAAPASAMATNPDYPVSPPTCAAPGERHVLAVYAHAQRAADSYFERLDRMREMVGEMNGHLRREAATAASDMSYKFRCDPDGRVHVERVHLEIDVSTANFGSILSEMRRQGYNGQDNAKYLMFYENNMGNIGGQGQIWDDDRLIPGNSNLQPGSLAIDYGYFDDSYGPLVLVHENGHNLGAVQMSAPNSSGGWHCNDGRDTMCYADGGSTSHYTGTACTDREWFDCRHDDYFNPSPAPGSYLATHWNLASSYNVYFDFTVRPNAAPLVRFFSCVDEPSGAGVADGCGVVVENPDTAFLNGGGNVSVDINWGDGTASHIGPLPVGSYLGASHTWANEGT